MALGFGFNKAKVLASAEKYVQQGKLQNAIGEYEKVAKEDSKDLTVLNTIGDLYARLGQTDKATSYFKKVGDSYAHDGFTVKAIAMYKKLTKLNPSAVEALQRLAEFYTQQGLYNDARQQYVAVADYWIKNNDQGAAAHVFQKMLELDPDNAAVQTKLADLYIKLGKKDDAKEIFFRASESLHMRGALDAADDALAKILNLDPANVRALMKRAQLAIDQGDGAAASRHLSQIKGIDSNPDGLALILRARMMTGETDAAEQTARTLAADHKDLSGVQVFGEWLITNGGLDKGLALLQEFSGQLSGDAIIRTLEPVLTRERENPAALEKLRSLYQKAGDKSHIVECTELLAHALVNSGDLTRARDLFAELTKIEPENPHHDQQYRQVLAKLGQDAAVRPLTAQEGSQAFMPADEMAGGDNAPEVEQAIKAALTDAELLESYKLPEKAIQPLEKVLAQAPKDIRIHQRLAQLYATTKRFGDAARCCEQLEAAFAADGHREEAKQYAEMAAAHKAAAQAATVPMTIDDWATAEVDTPAAEMPVEAAPPPAEFAVAAAAPVPAAAAPAHPEVDLSDEWETHAAAPSAAGESPAQEIVDEIKFYISQSMFPEATAAIARCEAVDPNHAELAGLRAQVAAATAAAQPAEFGIAVEPPAVAEFAMGPDAAPGFSMEVVAPVEAPAAELSVEAAPAAAVPAPAVAQTSAVAAAAAGAGTGDALGDLVSDLDSALGSDFQISAPPPPAPKATAAAAKPVPAPVPAPAPVVPPPAPVPAAAAPSEESSLLADIFDEFKEDAEKGTATEAEDPETHYNLGVAFREMGLMDEAIGELQKVCQAIERGAPFRDSIQAFTWLAQCFVDKGVPEASFRWYERALKMTMEDDQRLALHYDLANAYELAGDKAHALQHFMEVYGANIDYRDVAERIKALRS